MSGKTALQRILRRTYKYLGNPRSWFLFVVYPLMIFGFVVLRSWLLPMLLLSPLASGAIVYLISSTTCILTVVTIVSKLFHRDLQGQKLQIREKRGIKLDSK